MPTIKLTENKVTLINGKPSCECCCDFELPYARQAPLTKTQYDMFRAGGTMTLGAFAVESSVRFEGFTSGTNPQPYTANIFFEAERKQRIGVNGPNSIAVLNQAVAEGLMSSNLASAIQSSKCYLQTKEFRLWVGELNGPIMEQGFVYRNCNTDFGVCYVSPENQFLLNDGVIYHYAHKIRNQPQTINGVFSEHWLAYYVNTGIGLTFDYNNQLEQIVAWVFAVLRSREPSTLVGAYSNQTGAQITINLATPEGEIPLQLTDCTKASTSFVSVSNFTNSWVKYPTFTFTPSAP